MGKDTTLCISLAERPSNFGATLFNSIFCQMGMDWAYKPFCVDSKGLPGAVAAIRALNIRGCGVSMPHKISIMKHLDRIDLAAKQIGAVNTVVNQNGRLIGYNTDYIGFASAVREKYNASGKAVLVFGTGGAARAAMLAAKKLGAKKVFVCGRAFPKAKRLAAEFGGIPIRRKQITDAGAHLFFNATPIGMFPDISQMPISKKEVALFEAIADVVNNPVETTLIRTARKLGKKAIPGHRMSVLQGLAQFELYTGKKPIAV
jgi:shikimate dehydrogenase